MRKVVNGVTNRFVYDGWNLVSEIRDQMSEVGTNYYVWGLDLSGSLQGAGGIGGLIAAIQDGDVYFPCYDANGNVTELVDTNGAGVAPPVRGPRPVPLVECCSFRREQQRVVGFLSGH